MCSDTSHRGLSPLHIVCDLEASNDIPGPLRFRGSTGRHVMEGQSAFTQRGIRRACIDHPLGDRWALSTVPWSYALGPWAQRAVSGEI